MIDFPELIIKKRENLPDNWRVYNYRWLDSRVMEVTGAVAPLYVRGPKKGRINWSKKDKDTVRTFILLATELEEGIARREKETGKCHACEGTGMRVFGWSKAEGTKYKTCDLCKGSGGGSIEVV
jgi:hypothetical protein